MTDRAQVLANTVARCRERDIIIPTFAQMIDPGLIPEGIRRELTDIAIQDVHPRNLFRITWKNEPKAHGGGFGGLNFLEIPSSLSGVKARIFVLEGRYFPTGSHKVGATFGPLVSRLVRGEFDPTRQKALWPSTGNYCRGGAYDSALLACGSIAVLPLGMSRERFEWLAAIGSEVHGTPGSESNVKEIYDRTKQLKAERPDEVVVLNQFEEFANPMWHYACTGPALEEVFLQQAKPGQRLAAVCMTQGSAGTLGAAEYLRGRYPRVKVSVAEALQCPTLLYNGYGEHRIEGIGDKHVPWVHNLKGTDLVVGVDDNACIALMRLFNEPAGRVRLERSGIDPTLVAQLDGLGISGIANLLTCIKTARYYELNENDCLVTVATDSMDLYQSRVEEERERSGQYGDVSAAVHHERYLLGADRDAVLELSYWDRRRMHNLKYFTWIEQQGKTVEELDAQWYDDGYWIDRLEAWKALDVEIAAFNQRTGLLARYV